jgi:ABC-type polar amino acid transport system ATPase subunit
MITVLNLCKRFGAHTVLDDVTLEIRKGETVALLGPSGSGKTTLLRCLNGLERFESGTIEVEGISVGPANGAVQDPQKLRAIRMRCGFIFQHFNLFPHLDALRNITLAPIKVRGLSQAQAEVEAMELLDQMGLNSKAHNRPGKLSGGEQQRVAIARALAMKPDYLLYDEPTSALDGPRAREIWAIMKNLAAHGQTQVIVTHQEELAREVATRVIRIRDGKIEA